MAVVKIWQVVKQLDYTLDYAKNEEKTKNYDYKNQSDLRTDFGMHPMKTKQKNSSLYQV